MSSNEEKEVLRREEERPSPEDYAELVRLLQQEERLREEAERRLQESESLRLAQVAEAESLSLGTYYSTIDDVWTTKPMDYDHPNLFNALRRGTVPCFTQTYAITYHCASDERYVAVENSTRSSTASNTSTWPKDIFGGNPVGAHIAHLIPHSHSKACLYLDVVTWALGFPDNTHWSTLQKAIHGAKEEMSRSRMALTGIKHSVPNKIRLAGQYDFFDQDPCVLIIPILDLAEMKQWNGEGYNALVMCGSKKDRSDPPRVVIQASTVCQRIGMIERGPIASAPQIEKARQLLEHVLRGMAYSLLNRFQEKWNELPAVEDLRSSFRSPTGIEKLLVPDATSSTEKLKVRVVKFSNYDTPDEHPAPDPLLLSVKAAINWSRLHYQDLRAAGEHPEEEDELDVLAEEQYAEERKKLHRPKTWDDLARGLGQPLGYQGDDGVTT